MTITLSYYKRKEDFKPDYSCKYLKKFSGDTAGECMRQVEEFKYTHNLAEYTRTEIINVED